MSGRLSSVLAAALAALAVALFVLVLILAPGVDRMSTASFNWVDELPSLLVNVATVLVGAVLVARLPRNPIGWLLALLGLGFSVYPVVVVVVADAQRAGADAPLPTVLVAWVGNWIWVFGQAAAIFSLLLFPTGRPASPRWRLVVWFAAIILGALLFAAATHRGPLEAAPRLENPFGLPTPEFVITALIFMTLALEVVGCASLVLRFLRSTGEERQQIKWVALGAAIFAAWVLIEALFTLPSWTEAVGPAAIIASVAVAVLRYRLYDIDLLINRTLVYSSLTAALVAVYVGSVVLLQGLFRALTGQEQQSQLVIVASTLAIAALFNPLRRRTQAFVDRRFYRKKYDAEKVLAAFSARLREETNLDRLSGDLVAVVEESMQPAHASLWLRPSKSSEPPDGKKSLEILQRFSS